MFAKHHNFLTTKMIKKMDLKKKFLEDCGVDLTDYEYAGKFPSRNKKGVWGNIPRGEGWKRYAEWLESKLKNNSDLGDIVGQSEQLCPKCGSDNLESELNISDVIHNDSFRKDLNDAYYSYKEYEIDEGEVLSPQQFLDIYIIGYRKAVENHCV